MVLFTFILQVPAGVTASVSCDIAGYSATSGCLAGDQVQLSGTGLSTATECSDVTGWAPTAYSAVAGARTFFIKYTLPVVDIVDGSNARTATCTVTVSIMWRKHG